MKNCVIDATMGCNKGVFVFCPVEGDLNGDCQIITGLNMVSSKVPEGYKLVGIVHEEGQVAVEQFCFLCSDYLEELKK